MPDLPLYRASGRRHRDRPGESASAYRERRLARFRARLEGRRSIYVDINYLIELMSAAAGAPSRPAYGELLSILRAKVAAGSVFCPASGSVFMELDKQRDAGTRAATARLIDSLSLGAGLMSDNDLVATEIAQLLANAARQETPSAPRHLVWMPLGCIGPNLTAPELPVGVTPQKRQWIDKVYFDGLMDATMEDLAAVDHRHDPKVWVDLAQTLNEGKVAHDHQVDKFDDLLATEAMGAADAAAPMIAIAVEALRAQMKLPPGSLTMGPRWRNLIGLAMTDNADARRALPSLYVRAGLHALLRWNRGQKFKPNDAFDFAHAAGALGYCDYFFTEGPLRDLLARGPLQLSKASACQVISDPDEAVAAAAAV